LIFWASNLQTNIALDIALAQAIIRIVDWFRFLTSRIMSLHETANFLGKTNLSNFFRKCVSWTLLWISARL